MLEMNAVFARKTDEYPVWNCQIEKVVELGSKEFDDYINDPLANMDFIEESKDLMYKDREGQYHCLLVLGENRNDGILIEAEGYDYARYSSFVPQARAYIEREIERITEMFLKEITPNDDGSISVYLDDIEEYTGATARDDSDISRMFYKTLEKHPSVSAVEASGDCIFITPTTAQDQNITPDEIAVLQRRSDILNKTLDTLSEHYRGQELYDVLHDSCGLTNDEIAAEGFDLEDYFTSEQSDLNPEMSM